MRRMLKVLLGLCLLAVVVFGSIQVFERHEDEGRSPYEKLEDELGKEEETSTSSGQPPRYREGDPDCRADKAPGTVGTIGEDVVSGAVRVHDFVACFGPPLRRIEKAGRTCLYYRQREEQIYWRFCARGGRIVSATGSLPRPA